MARNKCIVATIATALSGVALSVAAVSGCTVTTSGQLNTHTASRPAQPPVAWRTENPAPQVGTSPFATYSASSGAASPGAASSGAASSGAANDAAGRSALTTSTANRAVADDSGMYDSKGFLIRRAPAEDPNHKTFRTIKHDELASLLGLTAEQARQRLKEIGHTGAVHVTTNWQEVPNCAPERVCWTEPRDGVDDNGRITLVLNKKYTPPPPPPPP